MTCDRPPCPFCGRPVNPIAGVCVFCGALYDPDLEPVGVPHLRGVRVPADGSAGLLRLRAPDDPNPGAPEAD